MSEELESIIAESPPLAWPESRIRQCVAMLEAVGFGQPGQSNTLVGMCAGACREIERLRKLVAFYQGEGKSSPIEQEYRSLADIPPQKRTRVQVKRLLVLARVLAKAVDASDLYFRRAMDESIAEIEAEVEREMPG